jgi:tyrosyl-tRNA synthetase
MRSGGVPRAKVRRPDADAGKRFSTGERALRASNAARRPPRASRVEHRTQMSSLFDELKWRGLVFDHTEGLRELLARERVVAYIGFDPTASSLHVGNLLTVLGLARLQSYGHTPIAIVGGGTGMIGDPSGKSQERKLLSRGQVDANAAAIQRQLAKFLDFDAPGNAARIVDNADWLGTVDVLTFLRDTGKHFTVNYMLQKESVSRRLESEDGISFTEFSYLVLQAYDFLQLFDRYGCVLQMGGSDQWGNITAGIELIRRLRARKAHGLVWPLMKTASGGKFGKTEAGAIWLDSERTPPFKFYQFWLNTEDSDVESYFKYFTFRSQAEIELLMHPAEPGTDARARQRVLARELTERVHGSDQAIRAERASEVLFTEEISAIPVEDILLVFDDVPSTDLPIGEVPADGIGLVDLLVRVQLAPSKSEARRLVQSGGAYVNNRRATDLHARLTRESAIGGRLFVLRKGQKQNHLVRLT